MKKKGLTYSDKFRIGSMQDLIDLIGEVGFVPFFANEIEGFSIEEHIGNGCWYPDADLQRIERVLGKR